MRHYELMKSVMHNLSSELKKRCETQFKAADATIYMYQGSLNGNEYKLKCTAKMSLLFEEYSVMLLKVIDLTDNKCTEIHLIDSICVDLVNLFHKELDTSE